MEIIVGSLDTHGDVSTAEIKHKDQQLYWNIALFDKTSFSGKYDIFNHINKFWAYLPPEKQDAIFNIYVNINYVFNTEWEPRKLPRLLSPLIAQLTALHDLQTIKHWIQYYSDIVIPFDIKDTFDESRENSNTRAKTYLKGDYEQLVVLTLALRTMIPIWGEYIFRTKGEHGTAFKEYYAADLLCDSDYEHSAPMEKLKEYILHNIPSEKDKSKASAIIGGISSEDFPKWVLGLVLVRRLCAGDIRGTDPSGHLVSSIWSYINQKVKTHENSFIGSVRAKITEDQASEDGNKLSRLEGYKDKQEVSAGDIEAICFFLEDTARVAQRVCPDIDLTLLAESELSIQQLEGETIWKPQMVLTQWVLSKALPVKILERIPGKLAYKAIAIAQALLWHRGHKELAAFVSAVSHPHTDSLMLSSSDSRARIPKDHLEILETLYPFSRKPPGKKKVFKRENPAVVAIESVASMISEHDWRITLPDRWMEELTGNKNIRRIAVPQDIKIKLSTLTIQLAKKEF